MNPLLNFDSFYKNKVYENSSFKSFNNIQTKDSELEAFIIDFIASNANSDFLDIALNLKKNDFNETDMFIKKVLKDLVLNKKISVINNKYYVK